MKCKHIQTQEEFKRWADKQHWLLIRIESFDNEECELRYITPNGQDISVLVGTLGLVHSVQTMTFTYSG